MEHYDFHSTRYLVDKQHQDRIAQASAERFARRQRRRPLIDPQGLLGLIRHRPTLRLRTRAQWSWR